MTGWWNNCAGYLETVLKSINHLVVHDVVLESKCYKSVWAGSKHKKDKLSILRDCSNNVITVTALNMIVLSEFKQSGISISHSCSQSFICLGNLFHFTTLEYASELLHFICRCLICLQNWSWLTAGVERTYFHWLPVCVLLGSILFVSGPSAIALFGSTHLFIDWTNNL